MSKREVLAGATDQTIDIFVQDSSSTVGAGLAALVFNSAGLLCYYRKGATGTPTALTLATLAAITTAHADGGFKEADATNMTGVYRLDLSDTIVAAAGMVTIYLYGATNMAPVVAEIEVVSVDKFNATNFGLSLVPANLTQLSGDATAADNAEAFFDGTGYAGTGNVIPTVTTLTNLPAITANWLTAAGTAADFTTEIQSGLATAAALDAIDNFVDAEIGDIQARLPAALTAGGNMKSQLADAVVHGGTTAKLELGSSSSTPALRVLSSGGNAVEWGATGADGKGFIIYGNGMGQAVHVTGGTKADGVLIETPGTANDALKLSGGGGGVGAGSDIYCAGNGEIRGSLTGMVMGEEAKPISAVGVWAAGSAGTTIPAYPANFAALVINASGHMVLQDGSLVTAKLGTFALAKTTNITGLNDLDAAGIRTSVGLGSANLDTQLGDLPTNSELVTSQASADDATLAAIAALNNLSSSQILTTQLTESYAADGAAPTLTQALLLIQQALTDFVIVGTTMTIRKIDGTTTAATLTLNDGTSPTGITRAT